MKDVDYISYNVQYLMLLGLSVLYLASSCNRDNRSAPAVHLVTSICPIARLSAVNSHSTRFEPSSLTRWVRLVSRTSRTIVGRRGWPRYIDRLASGADVQTCSTGSQRLPSTRFGHDARRSLYHPSGTVPKSFRSRPHRALDGTRQLWVYVSPDRPPRPGFG